MPEFAHLHVHTEFSLLDGLAKIDPLIARAKAMGMDALAITDHGVMYGVIEFYKVAQKHGIKPIIGCELYVAQRDRTQRDHQKDNKPYHLTVLARNEAGYKNLMKLATKAQLEGFYYRPRVDRELLEQHSNGLMVFSGCPTAQIPRLILDEQIKEAREMAGWFQEVFGKENFYLEIQQHNLDFLGRLNSELLAMSRALDIPLVATNDVHYIHAQDSYAHEVLLCVQTSTTMKNADRMRIGETFYLRSPEEMAGLFREVPEAITNTLRIAEMCEIKIEFGNYHLPIFPVPAGYDPESYLRHLCEKGIVERYPEATPEIWDRLNYELSVIHQMGFDTYFLIVWDLCRFARERGIWWNVRGSGAGSIVAYALRITNIDPLWQNLIFERFLNPGRVSMPDIDLDFPDDQREELIRYTFEKYGSDKVAQIITFGTMGARAAIRDAGRALDLLQGEVDRVARLVPAIPGMPITIAETLEGDRAVPELQKIYQEQDYIRELIDTARSLEGVARHASTHAAGVVISDIPLVEYLPLNRPTRGGDAEDALPVTQYPMEHVEEIGLLKIDFLGLATLTVLRRAAELIEQYQGEKLNMENIPLDDPAIYELLSSGNVTGVFQVEGAGMRRVLREMQPTQFEHIIAAISLYRPGPMEYIPSYIARMHGREPVEYRHPELKPILEETFAILVYQEQIIRIARDLAGYDAGEADLMRRAVGKKKKEDLLKHRGKFVKGAVERGIPEQTANQIFDDIEFFARYGFNKCLPGDVEVIDASTGRLVKIEDLYNGTAHMERTVVCDTGMLKMGTHSVAAVLNNGVKPVLRLTTALGRQIEATGNHPFYTLDGWRWLEELQVGDLIAVPRRLPIAGDTQWPDHEVIVLGHLLAEGNLCHPHSVYFYTQDEEQLNDYIRAVEQFDNVTCTVSLHKGSYSVYAKRTQREREPGVVPWVKDLGLWGKTAHEKEIPAAAFELNNRQIALLLSRLWEGDGHLSEQGDGYTYCYYATASERLARQIQHLLLRLGVTSRLRTVKFPYRDGRTGYQVFVLGREHIKHFAATVGEHFVSHKYRQLCAAAIETNYDAEYFDSQELATYAESDIYWDEILSIEYVGEKQTYDLTVPDFHNFIANDILVHNSHAADYAMIVCQTAYLKAKYPVEYMTALLSVERDNTEKIALIAANCHEMGIKLLPPSVNHSKLGFTIETLADDILQADTRLKHRRGIRFGLGAIKNVGEGPVEAILEVRREGGAFKNLDDFCRRVDLRKVQRRALECMIKVGALDEFGRRDPLLAVIDRMMGVSQKAHQAAEIGQLSMFGGEAAAALEGSIFEPLPNPPETPHKVQLGWEKELTGLFISEHPLYRMVDELDQLVTARCGEVDTSMAGQPVTLAGMVSSVRRITTRKGDPMAFAQVEDLQGSVEVTIFPRVWEQTRDVWKEDNLVILSGRVDVRDDRAQILCDKAKLYQPAERLESSNLEQAIDSPQSSSPNLAQEIVGQDTTLTDPGSADRATHGSVPEPAGMKSVPPVPDEATIKSEEARPAIDPLPPVTAPGSNGRPADTPASANGLQTAPAFESEEPAFHLFITLKRSEDEEADIQKIGQVYDVITQYEGHDRFSLVVVNGGDGIRLDFPNNTTRYCLSLLKSLEEMLGHDTVQVQPI